MLRPLNESRLPWGHPVHSLLMEGKERGGCYLKSALKWQFLIPSRWGQGLRALLLRFLLLGFLQALKERFFQVLQLPQGHSEDGGHVANEDSGPRVVLPSKERNNMSRESAWLLRTEMLTAE